MTAGIPRPLAERVLVLRDAGEPDRELARAARLGVRLLFPEDDDFPADLQGHPHAPPLLYLRGRPLPGAPRAALIGSRAASRGMCGFASRLAEACARAGVPVVSGLARGIDAAAHEGCLAGDGFPVAVLGTGVDRCYPSDTRRLHGTVRERGALLATWPLGSPPLAAHFPVRNRLVAALAAVVVVVQATEDSGTMSTARAALDTGTEVCAVPGSPDDPLARGTNRLIRDGARPVLEPADLLDPLVGLGVVPSEPPRRDRPECGPDGRIRRELHSAVLTPEELVEACRLPLELVLERLVALELDGRVERLPGRLYRAVPDRAERGRNPSGNPRERR